VLVCSATIVCVFEFYLVLEWVILGASEANNWRRSCGLSVKESLG
jgi:hypothetical protein